MAADDSVQPLRAAGRFGSAAEAVTALEHSDGRAGHLRILSPAWRFQGLRHAQRNVLSTARRPAALKFTRPAKESVTAKAADNQTEKLIQAFMRSHGVNRLQAIYALRLFYVLRGPGG